MLNLENVEVIYNNVILVLKGVSMQVPDGKIVSLLGANGAGKTTTLKAISGILYTELGEVTDGRIEFEGRTIGRMDPEDIVRLGIVQVMEGRKLFEQLTVDENLRVGAYSRSDAAEVRKDIEKIYQYFPHLIKLKDHISGYLSGGERQMVVMGRALMSRPKLMLLDEPSLGLSPLLVTEIFEIIRQINLREKTSILLVEQNAVMALGVSDYSYVMENGKVVIDGPSDILKKNEDIKEFYLGLSELGKRKSYKEVKHYKRRKRWLG
ncbi:MAG: ABC transporter ATP-binding protein [Thermodesulfobacteriota bacterium]|jgi:branched-chain amino acid transport system ATP-binding protein